MSLPAWECGLKSWRNFIPCRSWNVTPCVGVWIEIPDSELTNQEAVVTPCVGVWIEISAITFFRISLPVTPCVGVWIEISTLPHTARDLRSLPAWECGLK